MKVQEIMTENPSCCTVDMSLQEAAKMMADCDCGAIPVIDQNNKPLGVITDRDITIRTIAHGKNPMKMIVGEAMTDNPVTVSFDASVEECCNVMEKNQIRRILVTNENGAVCGIVAQADVANNAPKQQTAEVVQEVSKTATT